MPHIPAIYTLYLAMIILAFNGLYAKLINADPITITHLRCAIAASGFVLFLSLQKKSLRLNSWREYFGIYGLGILVGGHWATLFQAFQVSTVAVGILSFFTYPVITVFVEPLFTKHKISFKDILAGLVVIVGVIVMVSDELFGFSEPEDGLRAMSYVQGVFWGVFSACLMTVRNIVQKYQFPKVSSQSLMFHQVISVSIFALPFIDFTAVSNLDLNAWGMFAMLGLVSTAGGHTLVVISLKKLSAKTVAMIGCVQPAFTVILAWFFIGEVPELHVIIGGSIILSVALYESLTYRQGVKRI